MSIVVNGYTLNQPGDSANWSAIEYAFTSAVAALLPASGTTMVTTQHHHNLLLGEEGGDACVLASTVGNDGSVTFNPFTNDVDMDFVGTSSAFMKLDAALEILKMSDNKKIVLGAGTDADFYSDGTNGRLRGNFKEFTSVASLAAGEVYYCAAMGNALYMK